MNAKSPTARAMIIGCGIAGPATALFLKKAGFDPVIYEAESRADDYAGLFLNFARNGMRILKELGLDEQVRQAGISMNAMRMINGKGGVLGVMGSMSEEPQGYTVKRGELHKILRDEALRQGIPIEFGKRLKGIEQVGRDRVVARFEDGSSAAGAMLVGCDGIHSRTRRIVLPDAPEPSYTGLISFGGFVRSRSIRCDAGVQNMVFGKQAFFGYSIRDGEEVYWFGNLSFPGKPTRRELMSIPQEQWRDKVRKLYAKDIAPLPEIVRSTEEIGVYPIYDMPPVKKWHRQSAVLLGDAVHATSPNAGQGASQALEDAIVLAQCLRDLPDRWQAFSKFQQLRQERVEKIVRYARMIGNRKHATNPVQAYIRDKIMKAMLKPTKQRALDWVYDYTVNWEDKIR